MFDDRLAAALAARPAERVGVVGEDATPPRAVTWGELRALVARYRTQLTVLGLRPGRLAPILAERFTPADSAGWSSR